VRFYKKSKLKVCGWNFINVTKEAIQNDENIAFIKVTILGGLFLYWIALY
jgi:hypothetical protein